MKPASRARSIVAIGAAATALIVAVAIYSLVRTPAPPVLTPAPVVPPNDQTVPPTMIHVLSPAGTVSPPFAFEWSSPVESASYGLVVYDGTGKTLWSAVTNGTRIEMPPALMARLKPGTGHAWQVTAVNKRGERTVQSPRQRFVVSRRVPSP